MTNVEILGRARTANGVFGQHLPEFQPIGLEAAMPVADWPGRPEVHGFE